MSTSATTTISTSYNTDALPAVEQQQHRYDRYDGPVRATAAIVAGIVAGFLLLGSVEVGVSIAVDGHGPDNWNFTQWGSHWVWRAIASAVTTYVAGFLVGMIARQRGKPLAMISAVPTALFWLFVAYVGWAQGFPSGGAVVELPLGYKIISSVLLLVTLPIAASGGKAGAPYGRANAEHYDGRRGALLGVHWYHFLWLPFLVHAMVLTGAFGAAYGSQWFIAGWRAGMSIFSFVPILFYVGLVMTLTWLGTGAMKTYEALAGFDGENTSPVWKNVVRFGFGYTAGVMLAQSAIAFTHYGLSVLIQKVFG